MHLSSADKKRSSISLNLLATLLDAVGLPAARTADSCSPYLSTGTHSSSPTNLFPSQLASQLSGSTGLCQFRCRTSVSGRVTVTPL